MVLNEDANWHSKYTVYQDRIRFTCFFFSLYIIYYIRSSCVKWFEFFFFSSKTYNLRRVDNVSSIRIEFEFLLIDILLLLLLHREQNACHSDRWSDNWSYIFIYLLNVRKLLTFINNFYILVPTDCIYRIELTTRK